MMIKILIFCWVLTFRHTHWYVRWQRVLQRLLLRWKRHTWKDRNLWACCEVLLSVFSIVRLNEPIFQLIYHFVSVSFTDIDNMSKGRNNIDVDTSITIKICTRLQKQCFGMTLVDIIKNKNYSLNKTNLNDLQHKLVNPSPSTYIKSQLKKVLSTFNFFNR